MKRKNTSLPNAVPNAVLYTPDPVTVHVIDLTDSPTRRKRGDPNDDVTVVEFPDLSVLYTRASKKLLEKITNEDIDTELDQPIDSSAGGTIGDKGWLGTGHILNFVDAIRLAGIDVSNRVHILHGHALSMNVGPGPSSTMRRTLSTEKTDYQTRSVVKRRNKTWLESHKFSYRDNVGEEVAEALWYMLPRLRDEAYTRTHETVRSIFKRLTENANGRPYVVLAPIMSNGNHWTLAHITYDAEYHTLDIRLFDSLHEESTLELFGCKDDSPVFHCRELKDAFNAMDPLTQKKGATNVSYGKQQHQGESNYYDCSLFVCLAILRSIYGAVPDFSPLNDKQQVSKRDVKKVRRIIAAMIAYNRAVVKEAAPLRVAAPRTDKHGYITQSDVIPDDD
jgi:hypothetical protein